MTNANNDSVNELITKHLARETSPDEERELHSWMGQNADNQRHYQELKKAFDLTGQHLTASESDNLDIDIDREWDHFTESIGENKAAHPLSATRIWLRIAASLLLLLVSGAILYYYVSPDITSYQTADNKESFTLPDGSQVTLNRYTILSYKRAFGKETRTVNLTGEAFFDVQADRNKPFIVETSKAIVQVVGTAFNVNAYDSLTTVEVIVSSGVVSLKPKTGEKKVEVAAGQKGTYSDGGGQISSSVNDDVNFLSWNTGRIVFVDSDLRSVIETLRKTFRADITISADLSATCIVTVTFDQQDLESVLKVLESTLNLKYTINEEKVVITEAGC